MTWQNDASVIVGKHQNALKEIDSSFIERHNLPVIRRITGGGTVYHDPGNINFSFIFTDRKENLIDFKEFTRPIILFLQSLGLNAAFEGKNNITVDGLKVSGNSAHLYKNKVLYHGTLLFNSDIDMLDKAISGKEDLYEDKAVRSVRARVANISDLLKEKISIEKFIDLFINFILNHFDQVVEENLNDEEDQAIRKLAEEKYRSHRWNFGYSPDYEFNKKWVYNNDEYSVRLVVKGGIIEKAEFSGPEEYSEILRKTEDHLQFIYHEKSTVTKKFKILPEDYQSELLNHLVNHLF
jgi:lipoate-protein ligase A